MIFVWLDLGLNPGLPDHWRTLYPLGQWAGAKVKMATFVEGDTKASFLIATTLRCRGRRYSGLLHFTLDPHLIVLSAKKGSIEYHFFSLWYESTWDWTLVSWTIGEHSTSLILYIHIYWERERWKAKLQKVIVR